MPLQWFPGAAGRGFEAWPAPNFEPDVSHDPDPWPDRFFRGPSGVGTQKGPRWVCIAPFPYFGLVCPPPLPPPLAMLPGGTPSGGIGARGNLHHRPSAPRTTSSLVYGSGHLRLRPCAFAPAACPGAEIYGRVCPRRGPKGSSGQTGIDPSPQVRVPRVPDCSPPTEHQLDRWDRRLSCGPRIERTARVPQGSSGPGRGGDPPPCARGGGAKGAAGPQGRGLGSPLPLSS